MSEVFHWRNTLQTGEYLAVGTLSRILNTTIVFYGWFPIAWVYNIAIIAQFTCAPREVKNRHFGFLSYSYSIFSSGPTAIVSYLLTLVYMYIRSIFILTSVQYGCAEVWMTILENGWNLWVWLVGVVSRRWVWLVGGIYGYGYNV